MQELKEAEGMLYLKGEGAGKPKADFPSITSYEEPVRSITRTIRTVRKIKL